MSKDIWHFSSEAPAYCFLCVFEDSFDNEVHCGHYNPVKKQFCSTEGRYEINQVKKYCDLLHLLDCEQQLIRTRKALDKAKHALRELKDVIACPPDISYETGVSMYADGTLQEITAVEQKESK